MRRIFTLSVLLVVTGLLLPACGTHMTIAKRQHSRGYYVDISSDKKPAGTNAAKDLRDVDQENVAETKSTVKPEPRHVVKHTETVEKVALAEAQAATEAPVTAVEEKASVEKTTVPAEKSALQSEKPVSKTLKSTLKQEVKKFNQSSQVKKMQTQRADGLSLFWIVILVLLILWALGLIGGLGWFVHIALVVALVLLILWLLGIV